MKLELSTSNLHVEFECTDDSDNHLNVLTLLHNLIAELDDHQDVKLSIVSLVNDPDADPEPEYEDADPQ
ncbi:MAG: hypothetical protein EB127_07155 [Alphaproteobacteria bacterium]|nr:hypothetical protein [Alphaproteobacteria bacterium]